MVGGYGPSWQEGVAAGRSVVAAGSSVVAEGVHLGLPTSHLGGTGDRKRGGSGVRPKISRPTLSDLLLTTKPHLLKVLQAPKK